VGKNKKPSATTCQIIEVDVSHKPFAKPTQVRLEMGEPSCRGKLGWWTIQRSTAPHSAAQLDPGTTAGRPTSNHIMHIVGQHCKAWRVHSSSITRQPASSHLSQETLKTHGGFLGIKMIELGSRCQYNFS
jgi:hypothetical protein